MFDVSIDDFLASRANRKWRATKKKQTFSRILQASEEWRLLRNYFYEKSVKACVYCGSTENLQVDHIKPKSRYKELALKESNLQLLCVKCNLTKSASDKNNLLP